MTKLILRLCIGKGQNEKSPEVRARIGKLGGIVGLLCNVLLAALKLTVGLLLGSVAILADGLNNLSDTASSVVTIVGFRLAQHPADKDHPYGHGRFEYLAALGIAVVILIVGGELAKEAILRIVTPAPMNPAPIALWLLVGSALLKLWMHRFFKVLGRRTASSVLLAAAQDSRNDVLATSAVLTGCLAYRYLNVNLDGYIGLAVAVFILASGLRMVSETVSPLLGRRADGALTDGIVALLLSYDRILGIHDLLVHDYGPGRCYASVHAEISASEDTLECHELIDGIEARALAELFVHLVIHCDPVNEGNEEQNRLRALIERTLEAFDPRLSLHDFRLSHGEGGATLSFDVNIPYAMASKEAEVRASIAAAIGTEEKPLTADVRFDAY